MITQLPIRPSAQYAIRATITQRCLRISNTRPVVLQGHTRQYWTPPPPPPSTSPRLCDLYSRFASSPSSTETISSSGAPTPKRSLRPYIYASIFLCIGLTAGNYLCLVLAPRMNPPPGSNRDNRAVDYLTRRASKLPIVQSLSTDPAWTSHDAYTSVPVAERASRLTTGPLAGAHALGGYQRVFQNTQSGETVTVIYFGGALAGWPWVTHGGAIATVMDESLGRCAVQQFPSRTGVTANLELNYMSKVETHDFYVIRAVPEQGATETKCWVQGRLETLDGKVCVECRALFVVPKKLATKAMKDF